MNNTGYGLKQVVLLCEYFCTNIYDDFKVLSGYDIKTLLNGDKAEEFLMSNKTITTGQV